MADEEQIFAGENLLVKMYRTWPAVAVALALSACSASDPANDAPVELKEGEYAVVYSGQADGMFGTNSRAVDGLPKKLCLSAALDDADKVAKLARTYYKLHDGCTHEGADRVGNMVSGKMVCGLDPDRFSSGDWTIAYTGNLSNEAVRLEGKIKINIPTDNLTAEEREVMKDAPDAFDGVALVIEATRTGDCS